MDCNMERLSGQVVGQIAEILYCPFACASTAGPGIRFAESNPLTALPDIHPG